MFDYLQQLVITIEVIVSRHLANWNTVNLLKGWNAPRFRTHAVRVCVCVLADKAAARQNGSYYSAADNHQRLLAEEEELDRIVKELQATLPPSEGQLMCHTVDSFAHCGICADRVMQTPILIKLQKFSSSLLPCHIWNLWNCLSMCIKHRKHPD